MKDYLGENIKELRLQRGLNQPQLGNQLGVSKQCISNWENGNLMPSIDMLIRISDFFNVSTDYLLGRETEESINVSKLTDEQKASIRKLVIEFCKSNK